MSFQRGGFQSPGFQAGVDYGNPSSIVMSDIFLKASDLTYAEFQAMFGSNVPVGFSNFVPFMPGDHTYKTALFRAQIESDGIQSTRLQELRVDVDLPDIFKQGTATVSSSGQLDVTFSGPEFNIAPEIVCSMKSGTEFIKPRIENVTKTGFRIILRNAANAAVAGTVSWVAHGY